MLKEKRKTKTPKSGSGSGAKYWHDQDKVDHVVNWIEEYCTHPTGDLQGQPMKPPKWFIDDVVTPFFGTKKKNGYRRYQEAYLEIASGNAKSTLGICLALYFLCADNQFSPRVYCVAGAKEQARIIFNGAKQMVQANADLSESIQIYRDSLVFNHPDYGLSTMHVISADGDLQQGINPTAILFDETHVQPNSYLYDSLKKNFPKRKEPSLIMLTTAGVNFTWAAEVHDKAENILSGKTTSAGFLPIVYAAPLESDDFDEENWKLANPGWDYLNIELLRQEAEDAKKSATALAAFRRYHLNKWSGATITWITDERWMEGGTAAYGADQDDLRAFRSEYLTFEAMAGRKCYMGIDLSSSRDTTCVAYLFPPESEDERVKVITRVFVPEKTIMQRIHEETVSYSEWHKHNDVVITSGETQDYEEILHDIKENCKKLDVICIGYDRWNANEIVSELIKTEFECKPYRQDYADMNTPMDKIDNMLSRKELEHGGEPVLRWQCGNTQAKTRTIGGSEYKMPTKSSAKARIDAMVALIIATGIWIWKTQEKEVRDNSVVKKGITSIKLRQ